MNWDAISAISEVVGTLAVLITLIYLAIQMRIANKQRELETFRHSYDGTNEFCELFSEPDRADIVVRGRESLSNLTEAERLAFVFLHIRVLNTLESWYMQTMRTTRPGKYRDQQLQNIGAIIAAMFCFDGALEAWNEVKDTFLPFQEFFDNAVRSAQSQ